MIKTFFKKNKKQKTKTIEHTLEYTSTNDCENIDGGGWQLVRHVSASEGAFHPATDRLTGSDVYGTFDGNGQSSETWSISYENAKYNQFLFAFGDCSEWLISSVDSGIGEYFDNEETHNYSQH